MKHLSIIIILILVTLVVGGSWGYYFGLKRASDMWLDTLINSAIPPPPLPGERRIILSPEQCHELPYLIDNMDLARDTHQDIVDDLGRNRAWLKGGVDHQVWVDIYDEIIEILEAIK